MVRTIRTRRWWNTPTRTRMAGWCIAIRMGLSTGRPVAGTVRFKSKGGVEIKTAGCDDAKAARGARIRNYGVFAGENGPHVEKAL
ncbi:protein of unknown function [Candidatus Hydrogenisulfobacillus filiaventi]|uniref:Uncharacterized protein n=1 Tax=Candidatus Hydrogenisulfobacillus filiaventi TaxID=2707344 RepID=A0A6F8ZFC9_9FIRM|nr:protein of unknown function [Candidatus Hydrogenisulfobacillus filiaventi]